jgi:hypothetical protein
MCALALASCGRPEASSVPAPHSTATPAARAAASADAAAADHPAAADGADAGLPPEGSPDAASAAQISTCKSVAPASSALALAALAGDVAAVRKALGSGASADERNGDEPTPLMMALAPYIAEPGSSEAKEKQRRARKLEVARLLLSKGADASLADGDGMTALHRVVSGYDDEAVVEKWTALLLKAGAPVDARTCGGITALDMAEARGRAGVVRLLTEAGGQSPRRH